MTDDERNDARLSPDYDPAEQLRQQTAELDAEDERVSSQPTTPDPGDDATVPPPVADNDDDGYDPLPSPTVRE